MISLSGPLAPEAQEERDLIVRWLARNLPDTCEHKSYVLNHIKRAAHRG